MAVDIVIPAFGESVTSGVVQRWVKKDGDFVNTDDIVMELETDKVTGEVRAPASGTLQTLAKEGDTVNVGAVVARIAEGGAPAAAKSAPAAAAVNAEPKPATSVPASTATAVAEHEDVRATPLARKLAAEHNVDLSKITVPHGQRIREQDVLNYVNAGKNGSAIGAAAPAVAPRPQATPAPAAGPRQGSTRERMTPLRQRIAARLVQAQHTAAMLTTFNEVDMTAVMELRKQYKEDFEKKHGIGLGFMSFFVKAAANALKAFPMVNAYIVEEDGNPAIEKHDYCDIAVAVSTPKGLVVPVLRSCEKLSFAGVESGIKELATRAKDGKLALEDMQGGTFTITNGGIFGSLMSTPILNPPQSAILGMHAIKSRAVEYPAGSGQVAIRPMMYLALSYDHRIIDGAEAVQFLVRIKNAIEDPQRLLLEI
ncbi:MAG TPA: 2-oxoglutarate dehydrogenase complex dihydrolipoyllysine-residue succinyltransferase [Phycisphaerales bacterium]|nr:2-oxoglutarate dehydrogenase complex dihydrolipoyllysine-residue succinyltransferase [Phycisphaerales bacterium]